MIGKFISTLLAHFTSTIPLVLSMNYCKIGDYELEQFLQPVFFTMRSLAHTTTESKSSNDLCLHLQSNHLTHKSMEKLKHALTLRNNCITVLNISDNFEHSTKSKYVALKHLIECLSHKSCSLYNLSITFSGFTEQHMYHLVLLLVHSHSLGWLYFGDNSLSAGFALFCSALKMNKCLTYLDLAFVTLSDHDILFLADALHQHSKLSELHLMGSNPFHSPIFLKFLQKVFCVSSRSCLSCVDVGTRQYYLAMKQLESYQTSRQQNGLPQIHLEIYNMEENFRPMVKAENAAKNNMEKSLLTGEL